MPLEVSTSPKAFKSNVKELVNRYKSAGRIGTSRPANKQKAIKQAVAIAYSEKRKAAAKTLAHGT